MLDAKVATAELLQGALCLGTAPIGHCLHPCSLWLLSQERVLDPKLDDIHTQRTRLPTHATILVPVRQSIRLKAGTSTCVGRKQVDSTP